MLYLTKDDWNNIILSKLKENQSFTEQFLELRKIYKTLHIFIQKILKDFQKKYNLTPLFMTAMTIFHKYRISTNFSLNSHSSKEIYLILGACIIIAQKVINFLAARLSNVSEFILELIKKKEPNIKIGVNELNKKLEETEIHILINLRFNVDVDLLFHSQFFNKIKTHISKLNFISDKFFELLNIFIQDSYILPLSLYYTPNTIIISCIEILIQKYNLKQINIKELISQSQYKIDEEEIQECTSLMKHLEEAITELNKNANQNNKSKEIASSNTNRANTDETSVTKVIPSIKMNID